MNINHIYNKFIICQIDTQNSNVYITNATKWGIGIYEII
jgi:hypothetical protein